MLKLFPFILISMSAVTLPLASSSTLDELTETTMSATMYMDLQAQNWCAATGVAMARQGRWTVVRRKCTGDNVKSCEELCKALNAVKRYRSMSAVHVYPDPQSADETQKYTTKVTNNFNYQTGGNVAEGECGPNYCCCYRWTAN